MRRSIEESGMSKNVNDLLSLSQLARLCGLDRATVTKRLKDVPPDDEQPKKKLYRLESALPALIAGANAEMDGAKLRKIQADADLRELELKRERGDVISVRDVRNHAQALVRGLHQRAAVRMPTEIAPALYKAESPAQVTEILQRELGRLFNDLRDDHTSLL
jgi:transcriptional regulator with XRE-family HTH domain